MTSRLRVLLLIACGVICVRSTSAQAPAGVVRPADITSGTLIVTHPYGTIRVIRSDVALVRWRAATELTGLGALPGVFTIVADLPNYHAGNTASGFLIDVGAITRDNPNRIPVIWIEVPRELKTLELRLAGPGTIDVSDFDGELIIRADSASVTGRNLRGSILIAAGGNINIGVTHTAGDAPISVVGRDGTISVTLPDSTRAAYRLVTNCGKIVIDSVLRGLDGATGITGLVYRLSGEQIPWRTRDGIVAEYLLASSGCSPSTVENAAPGSALQRATVRVTTLKGNITVRMAGH